MRERSFRQTRSLKALPVLAALLLLTAGCNGDDIGALPEAVPAPGGSAGTDISVECTASAVIGDLCGGGIVYDDSYGISGDILIAALADVGGFAWAVSYVSDPNASNPSDGRLNVGTFDANHPASSACQNLSSNGHVDWYLPAQNEATSLSVQSALVGGMAPGSYWSSTQFDGLTAKAVPVPGGGAPTNIDKLTVLGVRCIRRPV